MYAAPNRGSRSSENRDRRTLRESPGVEKRDHPVMVTEPACVSGPFTVEGNPIMVEYEISARLFLPAPDSDVTPCISFMESSEQGEYVDVRWVTTDAREPRGVWERSTVITLPRQFAIAAYRVTGDAPLLEREAGA